MPHITETERRAQRRRDYAVQIDSLRKQAWDGGCTISTVRMDESGDECVVRFYVYHRHDDEARDSVRATGATFREAFKRASAKLPLAIKEVTEEAAFRAECADEPDPQQLWNDMLADHYEGLADEAWLEARAGS